MNPKADPLIEPSIVKIGQWLRTGELTADEMAKPMAADAWERVPPGLRPFIESPTLPVLATTLRSDPILYWHPLVVRQIRHLLKLRAALHGWWVKGYEGYPVEHPSLDASTVSHELRRLVECHACGVCSGYRIEWKPERQKSGPKGALRNPHAMWSDEGELIDEWVSAEALSEDFGVLRSAFKTRLKSMGNPKGGMKAKAKEWYKELAQEVFEDAADSKGVCSWADYKTYEKTYKVITVPVTVPSATRPLYWAGSSAPANPDDGDDWLDTSVTPYIHKTYDAVSASWKTVVEVEAKDVGEAILVSHWKPLNLDAALDAMLQGETGHEGKPAHLAYAVLGALLGVTPPEIRNTIDNWRHPRRRKKGSAPHPKKSQ